MNVTLTHYLLHKKNQDTKTRIKKFVVVVLVSCAYYVFWAVQLAGVRCSLVKYVHPSSVNLMRAWVNQWRWSRFWTSNLIIVNQRNCTGTFGIIFLQRFTSNGV
jgi:hypothetical protein